MPIHEASDCIADLRIGNEELILLLITMRLENLRVLRIGSTVDMAGYLVNAFIDRIALSKNTKVLSQLHTVQFYHLDDSQTQEIDWLKPFAALASVKTIDASGLASCKMGRDYDLHLKFRLPHGFSNVGTLVFNRCGMDYKWLFRYLGAFKGLKHFTYRGLHYEDPNFEPFWIVSGLLASAKCCLESLTLEDQSENRLPGRGNHMGRLSGFTVLKHLDTQYGLLLNHGTSCYDPKISDLDLLPATIETVRTTYITCEIWTLSCKT